MDEIRLTAVVKTFIAKEAVSVDMPLSEIEAILSCTRLEALRWIAVEECHYLKKRPAGDEVYYWCELSDHPCSVEYNDEECEEYNDQIKEKEEEDG